MLFLAEILDRVSKVSLKGVKSPGSKLQEGDQVVGTLSDELKKLYLVMVAASDRNGELCARLVKEIEEFGTSETLPVELQEMRKEHARILLERDLVKKAFWTCLRLHLPETGLSEIVLRKNWQVVVVDPRARLRKVLEDFVEDMLS